MCTPHRKSCSSRDNLAGLLRQVAPAAAGGERPPDRLWRAEPGTEVPTPGGAVEEAAIAITSPEAAEQSILVHHRAFAQAGLHTAWDRVIALVVQPGVEFSHESVMDYEHSQAESLGQVLRRYPGLVFEAHSTDYPRPKALAELVRDGFAILKVEPALTYAMRQALFALATIEEQCIPLPHQSRLREVIERAMLQQPEHWQKHYVGNPSAGSSSPHSQL